LRLIHQCCDVTNVHGLPDIRQLVFAPQSFEEVAEVFLRVLLCIHGGRAGLSHTRMTVVDIPLEGVIHATSTIAAQQMASSRRGDSMQWGFSFRDWLLAFSFLAALTLLAPNGARAQLLQGTIDGNVTDSSQDAIPG